MVEASDNFSRLLPAIRRVSRGGRGQNGQPGLTPGGPFRSALDFSGWALFVTIATAGMSGLHVDSAVEHAGLRRFAEQPILDAARYRYAAVGISDSDAPARASPDVAVLIEQHQMALGALTVAVPAAICR